MKSLFSSSLLVVALASGGVLAGPPHLRRQSGTSVSAPGPSGTGIYASGPSVKCSSDKMDTIRQAMEDAQNMANFAAERMAALPTSLPQLDDLMFGKDGDDWVKLIYSSKMFPDGYKDLSWRMSDSNVEIDYSCNNKVDVCTNQKGYYLSSTWQKKQGDDGKKGGKRTLNFCDRWFNSDDGTDHNFRDTQDIIDDCKSANPKACKSMKDLEFGRAQTILHTLKFDNVPATRGEYAWGVDQAEKLAEGQLEIPSTRPYDANGQLLCNGKCPRQLAYSDAATWAYIAAVQYFNNKTGKTIPLEPPA
ncbi:MAG: hypothetical protein Q9227_006614 [Pyrenula ochraceoflavens]